MATNTFRCFLVVWSGIQSTKTIFLSRKPRGERDNLLRFIYNNGKHLISENIEFEKCFLQGAFLSVMDAHWMLEEQTGSRRIHRGAAESNASFTVS